MFDIRTIEERSNQMMNILLIGGTGFVGQHFMQSVKGRNCHIYNVTRSPSKYQNSNSITYLSYDYLFHKLPKIDAVINLAGESLFGYWTKSKKKKIFQSRIDTTKKAIEMMAQMKTKPRVFINASAIGFYGTSHKKIFTEDTNKHGNDFLAKVVFEWEKTAKKAQKLDIRTVLARFGLILGQSGALPLMSLPVKFFVGGRIGHGKQWISWIHIDDVTKLIHFCINNEKIHGPVNFTSPYPQRNKDFIKTLAKVLKRPYYFPTPATFIKLGIGEMSDLIIKGQYVLPKKAEKYHYSFLFPKLEQSLQNIYNS